jgi:predicted nucleic acid-binding protein
MVADTCIWVALGDPNKGIDSEMAAIKRLVEYEADRRIALVKTDTVDTERTDGASADVAVERILETAGTLEVLGPLVLDHSRLDHSVFAGEEDDDRIGRVLEVLFPGSDRHATDRNSKHNLRDAMHVATSIRYGYNVFVTTDARLLKNAAAVQAQWNIEILSPTDAVRWVERRIEKERIRSTRRRSR